ncbi:hypothetical protein [Paenibacillus hunanensis]|uniref:DNA-directed RNA polymerase subunit RPC12/RpoP n=1 Tax=Paenibacillus hunanensis TaxID=539262 RepID=A0ABU1IYR5_9BACL|nr:hypothetical protein [Paenibacillus hunanensis]MDR6243507.1 DNA-directed RNA polymerase subunit RPC12/RpoP [Paenibacillus hunanensis]GGI98241.1 hypothetical protein GCM10008022_03700 [Paenibacillus hunanensis]
MEWIKYECENCKRRFAVEEEPADRLDEPCCPECAESNCVELGEMEGLE